MLFIARALTWRSVSRYWHRPCVAFALLSAALPAAAQEPAKVKLFDFERGPAGWTGGAGDRGGVGRVEVATEQRHGGKRALKFEYDFQDTTGTGYIYARAQVGAKLVGQPERITLWLRADGSGRRLTYRFRDATGEMFQRPAGALDETDWRELELPLTPDGATMWGGDEDKQLDYPLTFVELIIDKSHENQPLTGTVYVDDVALVTALGPEDHFALSIETDQPGRIFEPGDEPGRLDLVIRRFVRGRASGVLTWEVRDFFGAVPERREQNERFKGAGEWTRRISFPRSNLGCLTATAKLRVGDQEYRAEELVHVLDGPVNAGDRPGSAFGINGHLARDDEMERMALAGVKAMRADWLWRVCQPEPGEFRWDVLDDRYASAHKHGLQLLPILCYGVDWASTAPAGAEARDRHMPELEPWTQYVRANVARYKGRISAWEVWNEPNIGFWRSSQEDYARLLKATAEAIREVDPSALVVMGGTAGAPVGYIRRLYELGCKDYMDVINIHPYQYPRAPDVGLADSIRRVRDLMVEQGDGDKPLWITEIGWPNHTGERGVDLTTQAQYIARTYVLARSAGVEKVFWYDYQNGTDPAYNEHNFGIVFADNSPKPCLHALRTTARMLEGARFIKSLQMPESAAGYVFERGGRQILAAWALEDANLLGLRAKPPVMLTDLMGNSRRLTLEEGVTHLPLTAAPCFIEFSQDAEVELAPTAAVRFSPRRAIVFPGLQRPWDIEIQNLRGRSWLTGTLLIDFPPEWGAEPVGDDDTPVEQWQARAARLRRDFSVPPDTTHTVTIQLGAQQSAYGEYEVRARVYPLIEVDDADKRDEKAYQEAYHGAKVRTPPLADITGVLEIRPPVEVRLAPVFEATGRKVRATIRGVVPEREQELALAWTLTHGRGVHQPQEAFTLDPEGTVIRTVDVPGAPDTGGIQAELLLRNAEGAEVLVERHLSFARCPRREAAPTIDGLLDDWTGPSQLVLRDEEQVRQIEDWGGSEDTSATGRVAWDDKAFYLAVEVVDDAFSQTFPAAQAWQGDSLQLAVSDHYPAEKDAPYREFDLALVNGEPSLVSRRRGQDEARPVAGARLAVKVAEGRATYEAAIPWEALGFGPEAGRTIAFSLLVNDNDGEGRRGWLEWGSGIGLTKDPSAYLDLTLVPRE